MRNFNRSVMQFIREEEGLTVVEYAIAGGLVSVAVVLAFTALGDAVNVKIGEIIAAVLS